MLQIPLLPQVQPPLLPPTLGVGVLPLAGEVLDRAADPAPPIERAKRRIRELLEAGRPLVIAFSAGKDSSALAALVLSTAAEFTAAGHAAPPLVLTHSNTGVEQPEITALARQEIEKMRVYASEHGLSLHAMIGRPRLSDSFPVRVIGGRGLPAFADTRGDCSTDWKVRVNERLMKVALEQLTSTCSEKPVVLTGVRRQESIARDQRIAARGETADGTWENEKGLLRASPILDWSEDDVWEYIGLCASGLESSYSDFSDTMRIYRDAGGSSCVIVADMRAAAQSKPCGTRTGCWACTRVREDKSMGQMIRSDPRRYGYLQPLAQLRDFLAHTQYDWSRRTLVGRTIGDDGCIEIAADGYNADMLANLLRYTLSAQIESGVEIISAQQLIGIDARWSLYALHPPFTALRIAREVENGALEHAPAVAPAPKTPPPRLGRIFVGSDWQHANERNRTVGLRDVAMELHGHACGVDMRQLRNGEIALDYESEDAFEVDAEGAELFLTFEADRLIEEYCRQDLTDWTYGFLTYLRYGTLRVAKGKTRDTDLILRRSQWRQHHDLHGQRSAQELLAKCTTRYPLAQPIEGLNDSAPEQARQIPA